MLTSRDIESEVLKQLTYGPNWSAIENINDATTTSSSLAAKQIYDSYLVRTLERKYQGYHFLYIVMEKDKPNRTECLYCLAPEKILLDEIEQPNRCCYD